MYFEPLRVFSVVLIRGYGKRICNEQAIYFEIQPILLKFGFLKVSTSLVLRHCNIRDAYCHSVF